MSTITVTAAVPTIPGEVRWYPMAASQTFKKGEFVYLDGNGRLTVLSSTQSAQAGIAGLAMSDAQAAAQMAAGTSNPIPSGTTYTTTNIACPITLAKRGQQFTLNCTSGGSAQVTSKNMVGKKCEFVVDALSPENNEGDTYGRVIVEVLSASAQLDMSTS